MEYPYTVYTGFVLAVKRKKASTLTELIEMMRVAANGSGKDYVDLISRYTKVSKGDE